MSHIKSNQQRKIKKLQKKLGGLPDGFRQERKKTEEEKTSQQAQMNFDENAAASLMDLMDQHRQGQIDDKTYKQKKRALLGL